MDWLLIGFCVLVTTIIYCYIYPYLPSINKKIDEAEKEVEEMDIWERW